MCRGPAGSGHVEHALAVGDLLLIAAWWPLALLSVPIMATATATERADGARTDAGFLRRNESALTVVLAIVAAVGTLLGVLLPEIRRRSFRHRRSTVGR